MPVPTIKGQYRRVRYTDDGCTQYQCLWCMNHIEIRDDPQHWCFCPKCGKSWFTRLHCRERYYPRWAWDRWGDEYPSGVELFPPHKYPEWEWVVEERVKWPNDSWSEWKYEASYQVIHGELGAWRQALLSLNYHRDMIDDDPKGFRIQYEYRVITRKIKS